MDSPVTILRFLLLAVLLAPLAAAAGAGLLGRAGAGVRRFSVAFATLHLGLTSVLVAVSADELANRTDGGAARSGGVFSPVYVPGDPGHSGDADSQTHTTT